MPTDGKFVRLYNKRILPTVQFKDNFLDYLRSYIESVQSANYDLDGTIGLIVVPVTAPGNNNISVAPASGPFKGTTGLGRIINVAQADSRLVNVPVPPVAATTFHVALESALVEDGVEVNPRTGEFEYSQIKEDIGRLGTPNSVVNNGGLTLTFNVNTLLGTDDASGRKVRVWLKPKQSGGLVGPQSANAAVAFETRTVSFSGGNNTITTAAILGQNPASPSTTAADYIVMSEGPTIRKASQEDLRNTSGAWFLAALTSASAGNPVTGITTAEQRITTATLSTLASVLRLDAHLNLKILVKADASDVDEPQLEVKEVGGATVFVVDEDGNTVITATTGIALQATGGANSAGVKAIGGTGNSNGLEATATGTGKGVKVTAGNVEIPATNKFEFATARSRSLHIPASAFVIDNNWTTGKEPADVRYGTSYLGKYRNNAISVSPRTLGQCGRASARGDFHLPHGATITSMHVLYSADTAVNPNPDNTIVHGTIQAYRKVFSAGAITMTKLNSGSGGFTASSSSADDELVEASIGITSHTVDNTDATYELIAELTAMYNWYNENTTPLACTGGGAACSVLKDGRVFITGGQDGSAAMTNTYLYDPTTGLVKSMTAMGNARSHHYQFTMQSGKVVVIGGNTDTGGTAGQATCEIYDPEANSWANLTGTLANPLFGKAIMHPRGDGVYLLGGKDASNNNTPRKLSYINESACSALADSNADRSGCGLAFYTPGGVNATIRLAAIGGGSSYTSSSSTWSSYNPDNDTWSAGTNNLATTMVQPWAWTTPSGNVAIVGFDGTTTTAAYYGISGADNTMTWNRLNDCPYDTNGDIWFKHPNGEIILVSSSSGVRMVKMCFWADLNGGATVGDVTWKVVSDNFGSGVDETGYIRASKFFQAWSDACMLQNGEIIAIDTRDIFHVDALQGNVKPSVRKPALRFFGVRINYDYTENNPEM